MGEKNINYILGQDINWDMVIKGLGLVTEKEMEVATLSAGGLSVKEIAVKLNKSITTIKVQREEVFKKLGVDNVTKLSLVLQKLVDHNGEFRIP